MFGMEMDILNKHSSDLKDRILEQEELREMANSVLTHRRESLLAKNKKDLNRLDPLTMNN
jgi:hypothetical protein